MQSTGKIKVLFILGFGPIIRDTAESRKLYSESLGIRFKEESGEYLHTEALKGAKSFALWPLSQAAESCNDEPIWRPFLQMDQGKLRKRLHESHGMMGRGVIEVTRHDRLAAGYRLDPATGSTER